LVSKSVTFDLSGVMAVMLRYLAKCGCLRYNYLVVIKLDLYCLRRKCSLEDLVHGDM